MHLVSLNICFQICVRIVLVTITDIYYSVFDQNIVSYKAEDKYNIKSVVLWNNNNCFNPINKVHQYDKVKK